MVTVESLITQLKKVVADLEKLPPTTVITQLMVDEGGYTEPVGGNITKLVMEVNIFEPGETESGNQEVGLNLTYFVKN